MSKYVLSYCGCKTDMEHLLSSHTTGLMMIVIMLMMSLVDNNDDNEDPVTVSFCFIDCGGREPIFDLNKFR